MKILLTGHTGYIGSVLSQVLSKSNHQVSGLDANYFAQGPLGAGGTIIPAIQKDIRDITRDDLEGFDAIIHLAALSNDPLGELSSEWTYEINHQATIRIAKLAKEVGVPRFLYSSSCSVYGRTANDTVHEESPLQPLTHYAKSKARSEEDLSKLADKDFSPVCLRNATAYGASPNIRLDLVVNQLTAFAYTSGEIKLLSDGMAWRPIVHVEDIARAFMAMLTAPKKIIHNQAFNVGQDAENYLIRDIATEVTKKMHGARVVYASGASSDNRSYRVSFAKLTKTFPHFKLRWNLTKGIQELLATYGKLNLTKADLQNEKFIRITRLANLLEQNKLTTELRWR